MFPDSPNAIPASKNQKNAFGPLNVREKRTFTAFTRPFDIRVHSGQPNTNSPILKARLGPKK
jgi:hypothetical protein